MEETTTDSNSQNKLLPTGKSIESSDCDEESTKESLQSVNNSSQNVRLCIVGPLRLDGEVLQAARSFDASVVMSEDGSEWEHSTVGSTIFVVEDFSGCVFEKLHGLGHRILGPIALKELVGRGSQLPRYTRPLYTLAMWGLVICFTGFHKKDELARLIKLIRNMGGSIRKDMSSNVTHLVANKCAGEKYQYAITFRVPVMGASWVHHAWAMRPHIGFNAADLQNNVEHKLKPFHGARVCLHGFHDEEQKHMADVLIENGGTLTDKDDPQCTHVVVECHSSGFNGEVGLQNPTISFTSTFNNTTTPISKNKKSPLPNDSIMSLTPTAFAVNFTPLTNNSSNATAFNNTNNDSTLTKPEQLVTPKSSGCNNVDDAMVCDDSLVMKPKRLFDDNFNSDNFSSPQPLINSNCLNECISSSTPLHKNDSNNAGNGFDCLIDERRICNNERRSRFLEVVKQSSVRRDNLLTRCNNSRIVQESVSSSLSLSLIEKLVPRSRMSVCLPNELNLSPDNCKDKEVDAETSDNCSLSSPKPKKRRQTLSPKKMKTGTPKKDSGRGNANSAFKTPLLCTLRRSLRLKSVNHLTRWLSTNDILPANGDANCAPNSSDTPKTQSNPSTCTNPNTANNSLLEKNNEMVVDEEDSYHQNKQLHRMHYNSVIDESTISSVPTQVASTTTHIVKAEWFWASVQNEGCVDEKDYLFEDYLESLVSPSRQTPTSASTTPLSVGRARKRKRLQDVVSRMVASGTTTPAVNKRRSSVSDAGLLSCTPSPTTQLSDETEAISAIETPRKHMSPRHQVFLELVQTESNYVGILSTIMILFKEPLEKMCETENQLLNLTEIKIIFGHLPPIYQTHCQMLEQLKIAAAHWTEDVSIGNIFLKFAPDLVKAYPPFVNFFENTREMLLNCDQAKPRFHAFLKKCQTKPECGRQSLQELLIRPIQRLASVMLLLNDILKHTNKNNNDHSALEAALSVIREVMTHINEDKRRTEGQLAMFDIFNDIDNCPPHLVSSHRSFIARCDMTELSDSLSGRGDSIVFYLFSDILEVCKKRSKAFSNSMKSPNASMGTAKLSNCKPFKHVRLMPLSTIKRVIDIKETDECHRVFALMCKSNQELKEKLYSFMITDEETDKMVFLKSLCRQMANTVCRADAENFLASLDPEQLDIDTSDVGLGTLGKAFKFASRTRMRVGRAFSFNKTPSKLKRAMSTMMSPFGSSSNLTPASQLAQMRLASCTNLNELNGCSGTPPALPAPPQYAVPMSVQPQRRSKHSTLSVASLRRL